MSWNRGLALTLVLGALVVAGPAWGGNQAAYDQMIALGGQIETAKAPGGDPVELANLLAQYQALSDTLGGDDPAGVLGSRGTAAATTAPALVAPPAPTGGTATTANFANMTAVPIADNMTASSTITVTTADTYLWDLDLNTSITHTFAADLEITITSPAGTVVVVSTDNGGGNDDVYNGTLWDDSAGNVATDFTYANLVVATPLVPEGSFAAFMGEDPNGDWTLDIFDDAGGDSGSLDGWSLDVTTLNAPPIDDPVVNAVNGTAVPISDNMTSTTTVDIAGAGAFLCDVNVTTNITHTFAADLEITLTSPAGTTTTVSTDNGGGNDDVYNGTVWDDSAADTVTDFTYANLVVAATLQPEGSFGAFIGEDPNGTWTLDVFDDAGGDTGSIDSFAVDVVTCAGLPPNQPVVEIPTLSTGSLMALMALLGLAAFAMLRRRRA